MPAIEPIYHHIGSRVRELREIRKLRQSDLSEGIGRGTEYIGKIERGQTRIQLEDLRRLAVMLKVTLAELFQGIREPLARPKSARERSLRYETTARAAPSTESLTELVHVAGSLEQDDVEALTHMAQRLMARSLYRK